VYVWLIVLMACVCLYCIEELSEYTRPLIQITPEVSLFEAIQMLYKYRVHRLPVIDTSTGNALFIMTHKRILRFLFLYVSCCKECLFNILSPMGHNNASPMSPRILDLETLVI